jgi:signal transduction histidine kinase
MTDFRLRAIGTGAAVILLLGLGLVFTIRRFESVSAAQVAHVRREENSITTVERLRWSGELLVSVGRGYLISGEAEQLGRLARAEAAFDRNVASLRTGTPTAAEARRMTEVEQSAQEFRRVQHEILVSRQSSDAAVVRQRFEDQLQPLRRHLEESVNGLVAYKEEELGRVYRETELERGRLAHRLYGLLGVLATIEAGRFSVEPAPCDADRLVAEAVAMFETLMAGKQIRLAHANTDPGLAVRADRQRILQVLSNLLGNALKVTPAGGNVRVTVERWGGAARFGVADEGPGVPAEDVPHLFDRFWKHETRGTKGTGLGLYIAREIVDAHGGRIWCDSEPGRGAAFYFTLPVAAPERLTGT